MVRLLLLGARLPDSGIRRRLTVECKHSVYVAPVPKCIGPLCQEERLHRRFDRPVAGCLMSSCVSRRHGTIEGVTDRRHTKASDSTQRWWARMFTTVGKALERLGG